MNADSIPSMQASFSASITTGPVATAKDLAQGSASGGGRPGSHLARITCPRTGKGE
jgi:hypothetical protein